MDFQPEVIDVRKGPKMTHPTALGRIVVARRFASNQLVGFLLTLENVQPLQIRNQMMVVFGVNGPSYATVNRWGAEFRRGRTSLEDDP